MAKQYYVKRGEETSGPFRAKTLKEAARLGKLLRDDLLGYSTDGPWRKAESVSDLQFPDNVNDSFAAAETPSRPTAVAEEFELQSLDAPEVTTSTLRTTGNSPSSSTSIDQPEAGVTPADPSHNTGSPEFTLSSSLINLVAAVLVISGVLAMLYGFFLVSGREWQVFEYLGIGLIAVGGGLSKLSLGSQAKQQLAWIKSHELTKSVAAPPEVLFDFHEFDLTIAYLDIGEPWFIKRWFSPFIRYPTKWTEKTPYTVLERASMYKQLGKLHPFCFHSNRNTVISMVFPSEDSVRDDVWLVKGEDPKAVFAKIKSTRGGRPRRITDAEGKVIGTCTLVGSRAFACWLVKDLRGNTFLCEERYSHFSRILRALTFWNIFAPLVCAPLAITENGIHIADIKKNTGKKRWRRKLVAVGFTAITKKMDYRLLLGMLILHLNSRESRVDVFGVVQCKSCRHEGKLTVGLECANCGSIDWHGEH
jgi:hypothetical protein